MEDETDMTEAAATTPNLKGPDLYENWKAAEADEPYLGASEYSLFTDAHITGHVQEGYGPYQFLNTIAIGNESQARPTIVLRMNHHLKYDPGKLTMDKTEDERYHGGYINDEAAALLSLCLGARCVAGPQTREFEPDGDPKGKPIAYFGYEHPVLPPLRNRPIVPSARGTHNLSSLEPLKQLLQLSPEQANALVRSARLYQSALWTAESDPSSSWIKLVSSVECAAGLWRKTQETPLQRLRASRPDIEQILSDAGGQALVMKVAKSMAEYMGATSKFIKFIQAFLPSAPEPRPPKWACLKWTKSGLYDRLAKIYDYRSKALHGGKPFPPPMLEAPWEIEGGHLAELPVGLASATQGGVWLTTDIPMLLQPFEYLVRNSLVKWWLSMAMEAGSSVQEGP
jgi:hypothetical protein